MNKLLTVALLFPVGVWAEPMGLWIGEASYVEPLSSSSGTLHMGVPARLVKTFKEEWDCLVARKIMEEPHKIVECRPTAKPTGRKN